MIFAPRAEADLARIRNYIALFNPVAAQRMAARIIAAALSLTKFPERGRLLPGNRRELTVVPPYVLVYRVEDNRVLVLRVWHGAQSRGSR